MHLRLVECHSEANDCSVGKKRIHHETSALIHIFILFLATFSLDVAVLVGADHLV